MKKIGSALVLIVLGLIIIAFPLLGVVPFAILTGLAILFLGVGLLAVGITSMGENKGWGIAALVLGILAIILGLGFIFIPGWFSFAAAIFVFIAGILLIIAGIAAIASRIEGGLYGGLISLILGIIYIIVAVYIKDPLYLGILIGLWLLITGILTLFQD
ncbi:MAG: DUF308 domain-containing protein [Methanobacterium sp.]|nr:DUF308 domain-containing protein [Methanobacterium sp.]